MVVDSTRIVLGPDWCCELKESNQSNTYWLNLSCFFFCLCLTIKFIPCLFSKRNNNLKATLYHHSLHFIGTIFTIVSLIITLWSSFIKTMVQLMNYFFTYKLSLTLIHHNFHTNQLIIPYFNVIFRINHFYL